MTLLAQRMQVLTKDSRTNRYEQEKRDFEGKVAVWERAQKLKAKKALAELPGIIALAAKGGNNSLLLRIEIHFPYVIVEGHGYREFQPGWDPKDSKEFFDQDVITNKNLKYLPPGCRPLARWALHEGFKVRTVKWTRQDEEQRFLREFVHNIDTITSTVTAKRETWPLFEGLRIFW